MTFFSPPTFSFFWFESEFRMSKPSGVVAAAATVFAPVNESLVIRQITPEITIFSVPFARNLGIKIPFGGRSTAIKLHDNTVWLLASHPLCPETARVLKGMGEVGHIVVPDKEHTLYLGAFPSQRSCIILTLTHSLLTAA